MKFLQVAGRHVRVRDIEQVRLDGAEGIAAVWLYGRSEPLLSTPAEAQAVRRYVTEAMNG